LTYTGINSDVVIMKGGELPSGETMKSDGKSELIVYAEYEGKLWAREYTEECILEYMVETAPASN
tara:strand:- start:280 stop:474 length:195 start_codon:yes stop_codon:yes gene_type:complete